MFKPGDVVVCVDASPIDGFGCCDAPVREFLHEGGVYRISAVRFWGSVCGVQLCDDPNNAVHGYQMTCWHASRFRHLPKADSNFTASMRALRPLKVEETNS